MAVRAPAGGWGGAVVIGALASLLYAGTATYDYTWDDELVVERNPVVRSGEWQRALSTPYWPQELITGANNWRPLATFSWSLESKAVGGDPDRARPWHHVGNAALYGLTILPLFSIARRWLGSVNAAWIACVLFALHPAHTEVVPPVTGRTDLLAALGGLTMCATFWRYRETGKWYWLTLATLALIVGLGGKESAAPLVLLLPLADRLWYRRRWRDLVGRTALAYLPLLVITLLYVVFRIGVLGEHAFSHQDALSLGFADRLVLTARNTCVSLGLLVFPVHFHHLVTTLPAEAPFLYPLPGGPMKSLWLVGALLLWLGWAVIARGAPRAALLWVSTLLPWVPTSGLFPVAGGVSLRFLFLSTAFASCGAVAAGAWLLTRRSQLRAPLAVTTGAWCLGALTLTLVRTPAWHDDESFFRAILEAEPTSVLAHNGLGNAMAEVKQFEAARSSFTRAIEIAGEDRRSVKSRENLAMTYEFGPSGRRFGPDASLHEALAHYRRALQIDPGALRASLQMAQVFTVLARGVELEPSERLQLKRDALDTLLGVARIHDDHPARYEWHRNAARLAVELGENDVARRELALAASARMERKQFFLDNEGRAAWGRARQRSIFELEEALSLSPPAEERDLLTRQLQTIRDE